MNPRCQPYRSAIPDLFSEILAPEQASDIRRHLDECPDCRKYFESLECDDVLLVRFTDLMRPSVATMETAVLEAMANRPPESMATPILAHSSLRTSSLKLAVAATIVLATLGVIGYMFVPSRIPTPTLARTLAAMRSRPWVHSLTREPFSGAASRREDWECSDSRIRASRLPNGVVYYVSVSQNVAYSYDPDSNTVTVSFADDHRLSRYRMPLERLSEITQSVRQGRARIRVESGPVELIHLDLAGGSDMESITITRDLERDVLTRVERSAREGVKTRRIVTIFDYPDSGPADVYSLGVPVDAAIRDLRSKMPAPVRIEKPDAVSAPTSDGNGITPTEPEQEEPVAATPSADPSTEGVAGVVRDEQGKAVADATVVLFHRERRWGLDDEILQRTETDPNGRYLLTAPIHFKQTEPHDYTQDSYILFATHPDYALAWQNIRQGQVKPAYELTLTHPTTRTITVTDTAGNPIPGARVWLYEAGDRTDSNPLFRDYLYVETDVGLVGGTTDANGSATITNLPATDCCFNASLKGFATSLAFSSQNPIHLTLGADVSGWVLTPKGMPVAGAIVRLQAEWMWSQFLARSDSQGRFAFADLPAEGWDMSPWGKSEGGSGRYTIVLEHPDYAAADTKLHLRPGQVIDDFVIEVAAETTLVHCLVLEDGTDKPVPGARIAGDNKIGTINGYSDESGVFAVRVMPGPTTLSFHSPPNGVYILEGSRPDDSTVRFQAQGPEMNVVVKSPLMAGRLVAVPGTVLGPDRKPLANTAVYAAAGRFETATAGNYVRPTGADASGRFELKEVPAGRDLHLLAETKDHGLAVTRVVHIPDDVNDLPAIELLLQPTRSCAVVVLGRDGNPAADASLSVAPVVEGERMWMSSAERRGKTDHLGVLQMDGIIPGLTYRVRDARFDEVSGPLPSGYDKWLDCEIVLIPLP